MLVVSTFEGASLVDSQNSRSSSSPLAAVLPSSSISLTTVSMSMPTPSEGLVSSLACPEMSIREGSAAAGGRERGGEGGREGGRERGRKEGREGGRERGGRKGGREGGRERGSKGDREGRGRECAKCRVFIIYTCSMRTAQH